MESKQQWNKLTQRDITQGTGDIADEVRLHFVRSWEIQAMNKGILNLRGKRNS